ncbi:glycine zipper family protein [Pseudoalteromonas aurantia]|uniref:YMGG-like Gly-zipper domain-containing protein n=1 Tax=Pseudoalteromonas aurantia TaxID=43654 RepID=A0ABY2VZP4_9GAMM|nr:YMGG-like glycine zipper-containing protein [Pseudoalteromonas aurantia]TMO76084.1 hypothetical protein CWC20_06165 [Pseudoalteromonas aurantia]
MNKQKQLIGAVMLVSVLSGCAITDSTQTRAENAATGAMIGGAIGLVLGDNKQSALLGAAVGALIGDLYGRSVVKKKQDYANTEAYMLDVLKDAEQKLLAAKDERVLIEQSIAQHEAQLEALRAERAEVHSDTKGLEESQQSISTSLSKSNKLLAILKDEIAYQKDVLEQEKAAISVQLVSQSETVMTKLEAEKKALEKLHLQLASLDRRKLY